MASKLLIAHSSWDDPSACLRDTSAASWQLATMPNESGRFAEAELHKRGTFVYYFRLKNS